MASEIKGRLSEIIKNAMRAKDKDTLEFGRSLHAAIRKKEIDDRVDLDDAGVQKIVGTLIKQRKESIDQFQKGGRADLVLREETELKFLQTFLPEQMSEQEVRSLVAKAVEESGAKDPKEMGKVMKILMPQVEGKADGKLVSQLVREKLGAS